MTKGWSSRRTQLSVGAALATVLAVSGLGVNGPSPALAADTSATAGSDDVSGHGWIGHLADYHGLHGDASYVRFRTCPATVAADATTTSSTQDLADSTSEDTTATDPTTTATTPVPTTDTSSTTAVPNADVVADDPVFVVLPIKKDRAADYRRPERRRELCYDLGQQQLVTASDTATAATDTGTAVPDADTTAPTTTSTAPPPGG
jgi:hypothetical protein